MTTMKSYRVRSDNEAERHIAAASLEEAATQFFRLRHGDPGPDGDRIGAYVQVLPPEGGQWWTFRMEPVWQAVVVARPES